MAGHTQAYNRTAESQFDYNEDEALPVSQFYEQYKDKLPVLAIIIDGIYGETRFDTFDCKQVIRMQCTTSQPRVLCMREKDSVTCEWKYLTVPLTTDVIFRIMHSRRNVSQPMTLKEILEKYTLPLLLKLEDTEHNRKIKVGSSSVSCHDMGNLLIIEKFEEKYFKQNCIDGSELRMNSSPCMLCMNDEITVTTIKGFKHKDHRHFKDFLKELDQRVAKIDPKHYDKTDGNERWAEYQVDHITKRAEGLAIPVRMIPADAFKAIRAFQDEPLPPPPPIPTQVSLSRLPDPRQKLQPAKRSTSSPLSTSQKHEDVDDDEDEDNGDYEVPEMFTPELPPRRYTLYEGDTDTQNPPERLPTNLLTQLKSKIQVDDKTKTKKIPDPKDIKVKPSIRGVRSVPHDLKVHELVSGRTDSGYKNIQISRAVVHPQHRVKEENIYEENDVYCEIYSQTYDDVATRATLETDNRTPSQQDGVESNEEDGEYIFMDGRNLLPISPSQQKPSSSRQTSLRQPSHHTSHALPEPTVNPSSASGNGQSLPNVSKETPDFSGVKHLSIADVSKVLAVLKLDKYIDIFKENVVDGDLLSDLTTNDFMTEFNMKRLEALRLNKYVTNGHIPK